MFFEMRIGLYHGYELTGSGSNEYNRYLGRALARRGHEVHLLCREPHPENLAHVGRAVDWHRDGTPVERFQRKVEGPGSCTVHVLPHAAVNPVYLCDKQRKGVVKSYCELSEAELQEVHRLNVDVVTAVLQHHPLHVLLANHLVYQPVVAASACAITGTPWAIFPHGSSIEYVVRQDPRYLERAAEALERCRGLITGNEEVLGRILELYPDLAGSLREKSAIVGVGVDTSLFKPLARDDRPAAAKRLVGMVRAFGKSRDQGRSLQARLVAGEWQVVQEAVGEYDQSRPDEDLADKLARVDWREPVLLFVGALTSGKGLQGLLAAMPELLSRQPTAQLLIVGAGAYRETLEAFVLALIHRDEPLMDHLVSTGFDLDRNDLHGAWPDVAAYLTDPERRRQLLEHGPKLRDRVHFVGRLDHGQLRHLFPCADLAVFPSVVPEAYPLVLMESLANGVLPVVSDFSGFADGLEGLVPHLGEEWVDRMRLPVEPEGRVEAIATKLASLLGDERRADLGPRLRALAVEHFDWDVRAGQMEEALLRLAPVQAEPAPETDPHA